MKLNMKFVFWAALLSSSAIAAHPKGAEQISGLRGTENEGDARQTLGEVSELEHREMAELCQQGTVDSSGDYCCGQCNGQCGGSGCSGRPGGASQCCKGRIEDSGVICSDSSQVACIIPQLDTEWCQQGTVDSSGDYCCAECNGQCGGSGCSGQPGGASQCCKGHIEDSGVICSDSSQVACIIPGSGGGGGGGGGETAYITYHNYFSGQPLTQVACSDGTNGLITRWGYTTIDPMAPYVSAVSNLAWNSPNCGNCYAVSANGKTIYVTAIDQCGPAPGGGMHFDLHPEAFNELLGNAGIQAGSGYATFTEVAPSNCQGNKG